MIRVEGLTKNFGNTQAVKEISFEVRPGRTTVLLGPSGCGKTTTLRCLAGLERPSGGTVVIGRTTVSSSDGHWVPPEKRGLGMVFQSYAIWPHMTVFENVAFPLRVAGTRRSAVGPAVENALELVGLHDFGTKRANALSGGQQQRVALARAIAAEPEVVLFDEPLSNLDTKLRERTLIELMNIQARLNFTAIYVTHSQQEAMTIADKVIVLKDGVIEQEGSPRELYEHPTSAFVAGFMGTANMLPGTVRAVNASKCVVELDLGPSVSTTMAASSPVCGDRVQVLLRPNQLGLGPVDRSNRNTIVGTVRGNVYQGETIESHIGVGDTELRCRHPVETNVSIGAQVSIEVPPEKQYSAVMCQ